MGGVTLLEQLRETAGVARRGFARGRRARRRALQAMETVEAALRVDPMLAAEDRCRNLDVLDELLR